MNRKILLGIIIVTVFCLFTTTVLAENKSYVYRKRAEWVKLTELSSKQLAGQSLYHPYSEMTNDQMVSFLSSLKMNKAQVLKKGFKTAEIFSKEEANRFAPHVINALLQATPNQVVNVSIIHKRPYFVVRNDYISLVNVYVKEDGVHFYFSKLFAKLNGDYEQATNMYKAIRKAKSIRVSLAPAPNQIIGSNGKEIVVIPQSIISMDSAMREGAALAKKEDVLASPAVTVPVVTKPVAVPVIATPVTVLVTEPETVAQTDVLSLDDSALQPQEDVKTQLESLEGLKKAGLITNREYKKKRKDILKEL
ncbi:MAG: hypothetical protein ABII18_10185 [bacterium]|nr:hypothetical protein [bacterium]MBU1916920.1 hypothetical protein [bacterium]